MLAPSQEEISSILGVAIGVLPGVVAVCRSFLTHEYGAVVTDGFNESSSRRVRYDGVDSRA
jgi:TctA family transporter